MEQKIYTLQETAEILRMSEHSIYLWCRSGKIKAVKPGKKWLIPADEIQRLLTAEHDE